MPGVDEVILAAIMGVSGAATTGVFNQASANTQMQFQQGMSDTAWQRGVADMKLAGINPILAARVGGASSPGGASTTMPDLGSTALSAMRLGNETNLAEAAVELQGANARVANNKADISDPLAAAARLATGGINKAKDAGSRYKPRPKGKKVYRMKRYKGEPKRFKSSDLINWWSKK